jgi:hypothetical protein
VGKLKEARSEVGMKVASRVAGATHEHKIARGMCHAVFVRYSFAAWLAMGETWDYLLGANNMAVFPSGNVSLARSSRSSGRLKGIRGFAIFANRYTDWQTFKIPQFLQHQGCFNGIHHKSVRLLEERSCEGKGEGEMR